MYKSNKIFDAICYFQILPSKIYYDFLYLRTSQYKLIFTLELTLTASMISIPFVNRTRFDRDKGSNRLFRTLNQLKKIWYNIRICDNFSSLKNWNNTNIWTINKILTWMPVVAHFVRYRLKLQFDHVQKNNRGLDGSVPLVWLGFPNLKCPKRNMCLYHCV